MRKLSDFIKWYTYITISILIVCTIQFGIYCEEMIPLATLWQILLSGFLTTLVTVLLVLTEDNRKWMNVVRGVLHYILLCIIMIACGNWFGWLNLDLAGIGMMVGAVAVVYILSFGAYYITDLKQANEINQKLKEKYKEN